ncbi:MULTISPECIES: helix-turn-helix domain-containing protein [Brachybacterium]|uniref:helix-turn-helix domain-containing protein n=1 Tax=Brachybacterium TaxID=43668 RepID=UPI0006B67216|nr:MULTISPECIES: helix-turn-helix domain-containing protein [Brachybacterium]MCZ4327821.1 helix-turn-helix domain-containing protein [Brachybacterium paraconglomeratum]GAP79474.1 excisionase [Brachybacterium sp. SW0106-09]
MNTAQRRIPETYLPRDDERGQLLDLASALRERATLIAPQPALITADGRRFELPPDVARAFEQIVDHLAQGQGVTVVPHHRLLTTQEAADLLNVSRPTLVKLLESGEMPFEMRGRHRRVRLQDVLTFQHSLRQDRADTLDEMQDQAAEDGLYDLLDGPPPSTR